MRAGLQPRSDIGYCTDMLMIFALLSCAPLAADPALEGMDPARGWTGEATPVTITGSNLFPIVSLGAPDPVSGDFEAWLMASPPVRLEAVTYTDSEHLSATVPAGVDPGVYSLAVRTPDGGEVTQSEAFKVTRTRADHLSFVATSAAYDLGESAEILLELRDPDNGVVPEASNIEIVATSSAGGEALSFADTLVGQAPANDGVGITGQLDPDGKGKIRLSSTVPDDVVLRLHSLDDEDINDDELLLSWDSGGVASLTLAFPFSPFVTEAGVPFTVALALFDEFGNALDDTYARVVLVDECGSLRQTADIVGSAEIEITLEAACPVNRLYAVNQSFEAESEPFEVVASEVSGFALTAAPNAVTAGVDPVLVLIQAVDRFGNASADYRGPVELSDTVGGLDSGRLTCPDLEDGVTLCGAYLTVAASAVQLLATDSAALTGVSNDILVSAGPAADVQVTVMETEVTAGAPFGVTVRVIDAFGNPLSIEPGGADPVLFFDDTSTTTCAWTGPIDDSAHAFSCRVSQAQNDNLMVAVVASRGVTGTSLDSFNVVNAGLAEVVFTTPAATVAGQVFGMAAAGFDAFGNPYLVQSDPVVDLTDTTGSIDLASVTLDASGQSIASPTLTVAGDNVRLIATQAGIELGRSDAIVVSAASMGGFSVVPPAWLGVGESASVSVRAIDAFGNTVTTFTGTATLTATAGCIENTADGFALGVDQVEITCDEVALGAVLTAADGSGNVGESAAFDVVDFACALPPVANLAIEGDAEPVLCLSAETTEVEFDASGSTPGNSPIILYHFADSEGGDSRSGSATTSAIWSGAGAREVQVLVADADGCADETSTYAWVGNDDGEPTGPVELATSVATTTSGTSISFELAARDCTGDVAAGQSIFVRSNLGEVAASASGEGLALTLDAAGEASATWTFSSGYSGTATLFAGTASRGAFGEVAVVVTQDSERPTVVLVNPSGTDTGTIEEIEVVFSEALLSSTVSNVGLVGPSGTVLTTALLDVDTLTLTPQAPLDGSAGTYTLTVGSGVRDLAGNRLDGTFSGAAGDFSTTFGDVANTLPLLAGCSLDRSEFMPDGDDGTGEHADSVALTPVAATSPTWWQLLVLGDSGDWVRSAWTVGSLTTVVWDGRGDDGFVADAGTYTLSLSAIDAQGNVGAVCDERVVINQTVGLP